MELKIEQIEYPIKLNQSLTGLSTAPIQGPGYLWIMTKGLLTPDNDGRFFYTAMDNFSKLFLSPYLATGQHLVSHINNAIAIIGNDRNARVCVNAPLLIRARPKRSVSAGEPVAADDLADVTDMKLHGINVANDTGIMFFFQVNWRQVFYMDLEPIQPNGPSRPVTFEKELGKIWTRLTYPDVFDLTEDDFDTLSKMGWFPFVSIPQSKFVELVNCLKNKFDPKSAIKKIVDSFDDTVLDRMQKRIESNDFLKSEVKFFVEALDSYKHGRPISCISTISQRIEGVMRKLFTGRSEKPSQKTMPEVLMDYVTKRHPHSNLLFPAEFRNYLVTFYFRSFNIKPDEMASHISRHTQGHGVSESDIYTNETALIYLLIFDQIAWYTSPCN